MPNLLTCWSLCPSMLSLELPFKVRPEFLQDVGGHVDPELHAKLRYGVGSVSVLRVVGVRNSPPQLSFRLLPNN